MFNTYRIIHFVGIGGVGMSGIAEVLRNLGYEVTGSDVKESETTRRLAAMGIRISIGHDRAHVGHAHVVVISSAVPQTNPEVVEARRRSIPVIPRAEMLAELGRLKYGVLVAGAHGKTTTTSLIATILAEGGKDPTVVIGGKLKAIGSNAKLGQGDFLVAEADESDGSFLKLNPVIAVITNIDREHMEFFRDMENLKRAFITFMNKVPFYGVSIVCLENEHVREVLPFVERRVLTYGFSESADFCARDIRRSGTMMIFEALFRGEPLGTFSIPVPGVHNVLNGLAAIAAAREVQIPLPAIADAMRGFSGIQRRFELKGEVRGIRVYDDYGHHPAEVRATLKAARECFPDRKLSVLFQPHRYTRTRDHLDEFAESFGDCDVLYLMDIYPAGERPIEGVDSERLLGAMNARGLKKVVRVRDKRDIIGRLLSDLKPGDILMTLGAGNVYAIGEELLRELQASETVLRA
ncbi:MAG TPA: UDP-N-acetylmuramate--L-alanine ligase [Dissulfurispiraceae bacterium]|nr:UDP-N-acetylmuramate--L-alanine ligase [Dissulfurispiraceae bacterium]